MFRRYVMLLALALLLAACGGGGGDGVPVFAGASVQPKGNTMADALYGSFAQHIGAKDGDAGVTLYKVPADTKWLAVKQFYSEKLGGAGWQPDDALLVEGDTFSYAGWRKGGETFAIGLVEDNLGDGAYLTTGKVTR